MSQRYRYQTDEDGHEYLVPVEKMPEFREAMRKIYEENDFSPMASLDEFRIENFAGCYTFTDPRSDA